MSKEKEDCAWEQDYPGDYPVGGQAAASDSESRQLKHVQQIDQHREEKVSGHVGPTRCAG